MTNEEIAVELANHEQRIVSTEKRIKNVEEQQKQIQELTISVHDLAISVENMVKEQKKQGEQIAILEAEPVKKYKFIKETIVAAVLGALGGSLGTGIVAFLTNIL